MIKIFLLAKVSNLLITELAQTYGKLAGLPYIYGFLSMLPNIWQEEFLS